MTTDDDMREIEAALDDYGNAEVAVSVNIHGAPKRCIEAKQKVLALIRQKLEVAQKPATSAQPAADVARNDAEHEHAVAAWEAEATRISIHCGVAMQMVQRLRDEGARLMRARPAIELTNDEREAMKEPGVYAIDGRIVGVVDATATPIGRMVRMSARPVADKAAGELLHAAKGVVDQLAEKQDRDDLQAAIEAAERAGAR